MSLATLTALVVQYKYFIIAPAAFLFGPIVSLGSGVLLRLGTVELLPTCIALAGGELTGDVIWYWLGRHWGDPFVRKFGRFFGITHHRVEKAKRFFHLYHDLIIITSKLTGGFGFAPAIFFTAGLSRVHFGRYMTFNVLGQIIWTSGLLALGYFAGHLVTTVSNAFEKTFLLILFALSIGALIGFARYVKQRVDEE